MTPCRNTLDPTMCHAKESSPYLLGIMHAGILLKLIRLPVEILSKSTPFYRDILPLSSWSGH